MWSENYSLCKHSIIYTDNAKVTENHIIFRNTPEDYMKLLSVIIIELPEIIEEVYYLLTIIANDNKTNVFTASKSICCITDKNELHLLKFDIKIKRKKETNTK